MKGDNVMNNYILISTVGRTDPIRSGYDGPILHIIRHYNPRRVVLVLTDEIGKDEKLYDYNRKAIHLLNEQCEVELVYSGITNPHSYDEISTSLLRICSSEREKNPEDKILLNITSGTPQMETALCMIALADLRKYKAVQVETPVGTSNKSPMFNPESDTIEEWFKDDKDNLKGSKNRCCEPKLLNFKKPLIKSQIISLIKNYDYSGAFQLYKENSDDILSSKTGLLLQHAKYRLNLENRNAKNIAANLKIETQLYTIKDTKVEELVEFFNSMMIKQMRGELNDFVLRIEVLTEYLAIYILENCMGINKSDISTVSPGKNSKIYRLEQSKCEKKIPGISDYLNGIFKNTRSKAFEWGSPLSALHMVHIASFMASKKEYKKYNYCTAEMMYWTEISKEVRNSAAHTIMAVTDDLIKKHYKTNMGSAALCKNIKATLKVAFDKKISSDVFDIYEKINQMIIESMDE